MVTSTEVNQEKVLGYGYQLAESVGKEMVSSEFKRGGAVGRAHAYR